MIRKQKVKRTAEIRRRAAGMTAPMPPLPPLLIMTPKIERVARLLDAQAFDYFDHDPDVNDAGYGDMHSRRKYAIDTAHTIKQIFRGGM